jgi:hypothetical protein
MEGEQDTKRARSITAPLGGTRQLQLLELQRGTQRIDATDYSLE